MKAHQPLKRCLNQTLRCLYRENLYELKPELNRRRVDVVILERPGYWMTHIFHNPRIQIFRRPQSMKVKDSLLAR
jgi:hypothetical protein